MKESNPRFKMPLNASANMSNLRSELVKSSKLGFDLINIKYWLWSNLLSFKLPKLKYYGETHSIISLIFASHKHLIATIIRAKQDKKKIKLHTTLRFFTLRNLFPKKIFSYTFWRVGKLWNISIPNTSLEYSPALLIMYT